MEKDNKKQLTLKYKSVQRLIKEFNSYVKECNKIKEKLDKEEESKVEQYQIDKTKGFLLESETTRDEVKKKLRIFLDELIPIVNEIQDEELKQTEEYKTATEVVNAGLEIFK